MKKLMLALSLACLSVKAKAEEVVTITDTNHISLAGSVNFFSADLISKALENPEVKYLVINSGGGGLRAGYKIVDAIKLRPDVACISVYAASAAAYILQSCKTRLSIENTEILFHRMRRVFNGLSLTSDEILRYSQELKGLETDFMTVQAKRIGLSFSTFHKLCTNTWTINSGKAARRLGVVDKVVTVSCGEDLSSKFTPYFEGFGYSLIPACASLNKIGVAP
jgi:ATP-dependent protease ClpP protease subunit